jgi:hypothetical protein
MEGAPARSAEEPRFRDALATLRYQTLLRELQPGSDAGPAADAALAALAQRALVLAHQAAYETLLTCAGDNVRCFDGLLAEAESYPERPPAVAAAALRQVLEDRAQRLEGALARAAALVEDARTELVELGLGELAGAAPAAPCARTAVTPSPAPSEPSSARAGRTAVRPATPASRAGGSAVPPWLTTIYSAPPMLPHRTVNVVVGPFTRFSELARFRQALGGLPGVRCLRQRQLVQGVAQFYVQHDDPAALAARLEALRDFRSVVRAPSPTRIEVWLPGYLQPPVGSSILGSCVTT